MFYGNQVNDGAFQYYSRLRRVKKHVDQYYSEEISLEKAAQIAATEKTYFSTFFHKKVGITFTDWLRQIRVAKAIEIIKTRNQSICDIAFEVGFGDLRTFERAFKRYTNLTAREFKKSILPEHRTSGP
jgi:AraC-like DNA-binding protein